MTTATMLIMAIEVDYKDWKRLERTLLHRAPVAVKHAMRLTLNDLAFNTRQRSIATTKRKMTLRNRWTERSIQVRRATMSDMQSRVGSIAPYMETQEEGGQRRKKGKHGVPIPTKDARVSRSPKRLVRRANWQNKLSVARIDMRKFRKIRGRRARVAAVAREARKRGKRYIFLRTIKRRQGIYDMRGKRMKMLYQINRPSVIIKPRPWLEPSTDQAIKSGSLMYRARLLQQMRRRGLMTRGM